MLSIADARERVLRAAVPLGPPQTVSVEEAAGRYLAAPVVAGGAVPPFDNSAMDGWAVRSGPAGRRLRIGGDARAGAPSDERVGDGVAVRISTGAALPAGADAVVPVERSEQHGEEVLLTASASPGDHVRRAGEDVTPGQVVLRSGTRMDPPAIAAAVIAGAATVACAPRPRVAVLVTGDELRAPGRPLEPGAIHDSNRPALAAQAVAAGADVVLDARVADTRKATEDAFGRALEQVDLVVASGGVSVGPHDHVKPALDALGVTQDFWRVSLQPGKPTWFGTRDGVLVLALPGNPVSAAVCFALFARPALLALQGAEPRPRAATARLAEPIRRHGREQAVRVRVDTDPEGVAWARTTGRQNSHLVTSLLGADALALIPAGEGEAGLGEPVRLVPFP